MKDNYGFVKLFFKIIWLAVIIVAGYFLFFSSPIKKYDSEIPERFVNSYDKKTPFELMNMTFYYTDGVSLIPEDRRVGISDNPEILAGNVLSEYMKGSEDTDLYLPLPEKAEIRNFFFKDGTLYLDFSREIRVNFEGGVGAELCCLYGFVNTLSEINAVKEVRFLLNGEDPEVLISHIYTGEPLQRNEEIIQKF